MLREDYRPGVIAKGYESVGAAAISVLTDEEFFKGSLDDLTLVSEAVTIPVLRKDFILDPFQILEARAAGADAVLLIVAAHKDEDLKTLAARREICNLDILCEIHNRDEMMRAIDLGCEMIGVNSRDLTTMQVNPDDPRGYGALAAGEGAARGRERHSHAGGCGEPPGQGIRRLPRRRGADAPARACGGAGIADGRGLRVGSLGS